MEYTHRILISEEKLRNMFDIQPTTLGEQYKDGYLYGYLADGVLLGDLVEIDSEYVAFEWWINVEDKEVVKREGWWTLL